MAYLAAGGASVDEAVALIDALIDGPLYRPDQQSFLLYPYRELPGFLLCMKEVRVVPSAMYGRRSVGRDVDIAASILAGRPAIADTMITHRYPLDAAPEAFAKAGERGSGAIKVVLEP